MCFGSAVIDHTHLKRLVGILIKPGLVEGSMPMAGRLELDNLSGPFQSKAFCDFMIPNDSGCSVAGPALPPDYKSSCSSETPDSDDDSGSLPLPRDTNRDSEEEAEGDPAAK